MLFIHSVSLAAQAGAMIVAQLVEEEQCCDLLA